MKRSSGILLHPVSLPSRYGIGNLGCEARRFVDFLAASGQSVWQILPLGPTGYGDSPYNALSAFAGNPLLIDLDALAATGELQTDELERIASPTGPIDYRTVIKTRQELFWKAARRFANAPGLELRRAGYADFCAKQADWLDDYALFMTLREQHEERSWSEWPVGCKLREAEELSGVCTRLEDTIYLHKYLQFVFFEQWHALKSYANRHGILILGDLPIFVAYDSADVWAHRQLFQLQADGRPEAVAGVPPDYFSATGQLWGNPLYNWEQLRASHFSWWLKRFKHQLEMVDMVRVDHFRGFQACWSIPANARTAVDGHWEEVPGRELFQSLIKIHPEAPIVAEDLGVITAEVEALRDEFQFPGMKVLQFAFDSGPSNPYLPQNHVAHCIVYTGTHDNNTTLGWWRSLPGGIKEQVRTQLGEKRPDIPWDLIEMAMASVAELCIIPCQDILGLDQTARFNRPGHATGNWRWRLNPGHLNDALSTKLFNLTAKHYR